MYMKSSHYQHWTWAGKMAQWVMVLVANLGDLSPAPRTTHMAEGEKSQQAVVLDLYSSAGALVCTYRCKHTHNK
ncbi:mCG147794 [Mus musculus]|nr:mCG147794 [Mus musculus]